MKASSCLDARPGGSAHLHLRLTFDNVRRRPHPRCGTIVPRPRQRIAAARPRHRGSSSPSTRTNFRGKHLPFPSPSSFNLIVLLILRPRRTTRLLPYGRCKNEEGRVPRRHDASTASEGDRA